ncbi:MAG: hypothetical protein ABI840_04205 [bacterium]
MNNTKLIQLLKTFTHHEFHEFGKFINSPFHNESHMMILFYDYLKNHYPDFNGADFTKENIYKKIYSEGKYEDKKVRERFSDMLTLAEDYLAFIDLKMNHYKLKSHTLEQLAARRLDVHFNKKVKEIHTILDSKAIKDIDYYHDSYLFQRVSTDFYDNRELMGKRMHRLDDLSLEVDFFQTFFVTQMVFYYVLMKNKEHHLNYKFKYRFYEQVMSFADENNFDDNIMVKFYSLTLKLMENSEDEKLYYKLKKLFIHSAHLLGITHKVIIGTELHNVALNNFMTEKPGFEKEQFEIFKLLLEYESYSMEEGWMSREIYFNGVIISVAANDLEWAENFIKYYTLRVAPDKRENAHLYVTGLWQYTQKKYDPALDSLSKIRGTDFYYYIRIHALRSKIYFEQAEYEKVLNLISSFKQFLTTTPAIPEMIKKRYTNYINALHKLTLLVTSANCNEYDISKLEKEIKSFLFDEITTNKTWLLEKVSELRRSTK